VSHTNWALLKMDSQPDTAAWLFPAPPAGDTPWLSASVCASESTTSGQPAAAAVNRLALMVSETWSLTTHAPAGMVSAT
jgi:hypothetical protein